MLPTAPARWLGSLAVAAIVLGGAFALKATLASGGDHAPGRETHMVATGQNPPLTGGAAPPALADQFSVFRRARTSDDDIGPRAHGALVSHFFTDQTHLAAKLPPVQGIGRATDADLFIAGGPNDTVCLLALPPGADGPGGQCTTAEVAASGRSVVTLERGATVDIYGVVADGIQQVTVTLADGTAAVLPVSGNTYTATLPGPRRTVSYDGPNGPTTIPAGS